MIEPKQLLKSKTVDLNAAYLALFIILGAYGVNVPQEAVAAGAVIMNFILRLVTRQPLSEK